MLTGPDTLQQNIYKDRSSELVLENHEERVWREFQG